MSADTMTTPADVCGKPRLLDGLVIVRLADGLLIEGGAERRVLRGRHALSMMPRLIASIDGTRTIQQVTEALDGVPADHVRRGVQLLRSLGLVESATEHAEILGRLDGAEVVVVADELPARVLARQLDAVGVGETATVPDSVLITRRLELGPRPDLVVVVDGPPDRRSISRLDRSCARAGVRWLRTAIHPDAVETGPLFGPNEPLCHRCFLANAPEPFSRRVFDASVIEAWAALVATEVLSILAGVGTSVTAGQVTVFDLELWEDRRSSYPSCGPHEDRSQLERR